MLLLLLLLLLFAAAAAAAAAVVVGVEVVAIALVFCCGCCLNWCSRLSEFGTRLLCHCYRQSVLRIYVVQQHNIWMVLIYATVLMPFAFRQCPHAQ